jgi:hypothetical protein
MDDVDSDRSCVVFLFVCNISPDLASVTSFDVEENDLIVIATDGVWDNLPDSTILEETKQIIVSRANSIDVRRMNDTGCGQRCSNWLTSSIDPTEQKRQRMPFDRELNVIVEHRWFVF